MKNIQSIGEERVKKASRASPKSLRNRGSRVLKIQADQENRIGYTPKSFENELLALWPEIAIMLPKGNLGDPNKIIYQGFRAYQAGRSVELPFLILGGKEIREEESLISNFGMLATRFWRTPKKAVSEENNGWEIVDYKKSPQKKIASRRQFDYAKLEEMQKNSPLPKKGAIINQPGWSIFFNDCAIAGAISAEKEFHIAHPDGANLPDRYLWNFKEYRPTALGRELYILKVAGYKRIETPTFLGVTFAQAVDGAKMYSFTALFRRAATVNSLEDIREILNVSHTNTCAREVV